jgi:hypothetical protein
MSNPVLPVDSSFYLFIFRFCFLFCTEKMEESDVQRPSPEHVRLRLFNWTRKTLQLRADAPSQADVVAVGGLQSIHFPTPLQQIVSMGKSFGQSEKFDLRVTSCITQNGLL